MKIDVLEVNGFLPALQGMRNPMESWGKSDSYCSDQGTVFIGENDLKLAKNLCKAGSSHRKFMRMITVTMFVEAFQPWWSEWDTYNFTVRNSCSKMHKIASKHFTHDDFETKGIDLVDYAGDALANVAKVCDKLNEDFARTGEKKYWRALIELLPEGYKLKSTIQMNYETLAAIYGQRKGHKLAEWKQFRTVIEQLPYSELILIASGVEPDGYED